MDLPILKHLDTLIGLAVVMLIASTVVVAVTQFIQSSRSARSKYLLDALTDLVLQIAPKLERAKAVYVAERMLRHPLVGRPRWTRLDLRPWFRRAQASVMTSTSSHLPLPKVARGEVIMRHEIIGGLLDWAAGHGPLAQQDRELTGTDEIARENIDGILESLRAALAECGVADADAAGRMARANLVEFERANPGQPSQNWHTNALVSTGLGDLTGRVFGWYDNSMERVTEFYSLNAKVVACVVGFAFCFLTQLDSIDLLRRLSQDESLRAALRAKAEVAMKRYEETTGVKPGPAAAVAAVAPPATPKTDNAGPDEGKAKEGDASAVDAQTPPAGAPVATAAAQADAALQRDKAEQQIREAVEELRDPKAAVIPEHFLWDEVTQLRIPPQGDLNLKAYDKNATALTLSVDARAFNIPLPVGCLELFPQCPANAIQRAQAPVQVYADTNSLTLVARSPEVITLQLATAGGAAAPIDGSLWRGRDWTGFQHRAPGVFLSWVLLTLGAPFWYDFLKKLLGLRSLLQSKDEAERETRRGEQKEGATTVWPATVAAVGAPPPELQGELTAVTLSRNAALRTQPNMQAPVARSLAAGHLVNVEGFVDGQAVLAGASTNSKWHKTVEDDYLWDGEVQPLEKGALSLG